MTVLDFKNVSYINNNNIILDNFSVSIEDGDFISIVGPSGSGKSTFLKLCCNLISPSKGNIFFKDKSIFDYNPIALRKSISYVFQTPYLFGNTVIDNILFPYKIRDIEPDNVKIAELFSMFNLNESDLTKEIKNLSGGEKQRISLIRSILFNPDILLLDEITASLDADNTAIVEKVIETLNKKGVTVLWITHNPEQSRRYANKLLTIENGKLASLEVLK